MNKVTVNLPEKISERDLLYHAHIGELALLDHLGKAGENEIDPEKKHEYARQYGNEVFYADLFQDAIDYLETGRCSE